MREVQAGTAAFEEVRILAARVLAQDRYLVSRVPQAQESHVLGAFDGTRCAGFLRYLIQVIGAEAGRPAVIHNGEPLREGYVEAFGVDPQRRRRGIGTALQQRAAQQSQTVADRITMHGEYQPLIIRFCRVEWVHEISGDEGWPAAGLLAGAPAGWLPHGGVGRLIA